MKIWGRKIETDSCEVSVIVNLSYWSLGGLLYYEKHGQGLKMGGVLRLFPLRLRAEWRSPQLRRFLCASIQQWKDRRALR